MPVAVDISLAEMTSAALLYETQRLTLVEKREGGHGNSGYGFDRGVLKQGVAYFRGSNSIVLGDRASVVTTALVESLLVRMSWPGIKFACPVQRPNDDQLWSFSGTRAAQTVTLDSALFEGYLTVTAAGTVTSDGYRAAVSPVLKSSDPTLSNLRVAVRAGAPCSAGGKLFFVTQDVTGGPLNGLLPTRGLAELPAGARIEWRAPWLGARLMTNATVTLSRQGALAGPWSFDFEEAD